MKLVQASVRPPLPGRLRKARRVPFSTPLSEAVARFDNAPFQIRRKPSKAGASSAAGGCPLCCAACSAHGRANNDG